jgi:hypothetical protein
MPTAPRKPWYRSGLAWQRALALACGIFVWAYYIIAFDVREPWDHNTLWPYRGIVSLGACAATALSVRQCWSVPLRIWCGEIAFQLVSGVTSSGMILPPGAMSLYVGIVPAYFGVTCGLFVAVLWKLIHQGHVQAP